MTDVAINEAAAPTESEDAAWASFLTPLSVETLKTFCLDIERLFRINPYLEFDCWEQRGENRYHFRGRNSSQEPAFEFELDLNVEPTEDGLVIRYDQGVKTSTTLRIEPADVGSKLTIIEDYSGRPEVERNDHLQEVDKSLTRWAGDLQEFLMMWQRWSRFSLWRWYMRRIWQPLKPTGRRIVYMFIWISVVEVALIALGAAIYWNEYT